MNPIAKNTRPRRFKWMFVVIAIFLAAQPRLTAQDQDIAKKLPFTPTTLCQIASNTKPSHALADYAGDFEHPAYGVLKVGLKDGTLQMDFHKIRLPLNHFHYDRFETPDDEIYGRTAINFQTNPQGDVDKAVISLDEAEVVFTPKPTTLSPELLARLAGTYELPSGVKCQVILKDKGTLFLAVPGEVDQELIPYKGLLFRIKLFADVVFEFVLENDQVKALKQRDPSGEYVFPRR